jgi:tRNA-(ms[2]io[6]A)-hydroxylase
LLALASTTDPQWVQRVLPDLDQLLLDHAHCEKKAASSAINLIFRYQSEPRLMRPLSALAREELEHFEQMLDILAARGIPFEPQHPSRYAGELFKCVRHGEPERLLDTLLVSAFIEARSCERMRLLSEHLPDAELRELYRSLLACEARHHHDYVSLAETLCGRDVARARLAEVAAFEASVIERLPPEQRFHG